MQIYICVCRCVCACIYSGTNYAFIWYPENEFYQIKNQKHDEYARISYKEDQKLKSRIPLVCAVHACEGGS